MYNILTLNAISPKGLAKLPPEEFKVSSDFENPDEAPIAFPRLNATCTQAAPSISPPFEMCIRDRPINIRF